MEVTKWLKPSSSRREIVGSKVGRIIETTEERNGEAELHRLRGDLLNATGDPSAAERSYHQALAVAKLQSAKLFELQASISLARLWCKQDRRGEARDLLAPIYGCHRRLRHA
jgi:predicted ATPase